MQSLAEQRKVQKERVYVHPTALVESSDIGPGTRIWAFVHVLKGAVIGQNCNIGDHCFIEGGARVGNDVVIKNGIAIWSGVTVEDRVFLGPNVAFTNDLIPRAKVFHQTHETTLIKTAASLGANVTVVAPVTIGRSALVGAGSVVTKEVPDFGLAYGNPARLVGFVCECGRRLRFDADSARTTCDCNALYERLGSSVTKLEEF